MMIYIISTQARQQLESLKAKAAASQQLRVAAARGGLQE